MEKNVGIVCEWNPFHKGHAYLMTRVKEAFPQKGILCVMSGNFVQRGELAIQEKYSRARSALSNGADLVLELPFPFSCLSAESFAVSAVSIMARSGVCDTIAFGTEYADEKALVRCARQLCSEEFTTALKAHLADNPGLGYPAAREAVYSRLYGATEFLSASNASLALEYLKAIERMSYDLTPFAVERKGEGIRSLEEKGEFLSATALRRMLLEGKDASFAVPSATALEWQREREAGRFPVNTESLWQILRYLLKTKSRRELSCYYGFSALCDRARRFAGKSDSMEDLVSKMKNAAVTDSRIRRGLLSVLCEIPRHAEKELPAYSLVLGANEKGREMLAEMKEKASIPVFTKPAHVLKCKDPAVKRQGGAAYAAEEIYAMAFPKIQEDGYFLKQSPDMINKS